MTREIRGGVPAEIRENQKGGIDVTGYAAVYNERADIGGMFYEEIERGAFAEAVNRDDVVFLINHDGLPLARTRSGTLKLTEDDHGLRMETTLDADDPDVKSIIGKMKRGDLDKMSFAFRMEGGKEEWDDSQDMPVRTIKRVGSLHDVAIVTTPAYEGTEIGLRSLEQHRSKTKSKNFNAAAKRVRNKNNLALAGREYGIAPNNTQTKGI
jgi:HK97 family phage prohead protease